MGIYLNNDINANSIIINNMYSKIQSKTTQFLNTDTEDFDSLLNTNRKNDKKETSYSEKNKNSLDKELKNNELKKILDKSKMERMMAKLEQDEQLNAIKNTFIQQVENSDILNNLQNSVQNLGFSASAMTKNLCRNAYSVAQMNPIVSTAVSTVL